jgi:RNA polymerase-binding transcription factor DksA
MDVTALRRRLERDLAETDHTLATIRERLAVGQREGGGEITLMDQHPADAASDTEARELDLTQERMLGARVARIQQALERMDQGTYGRCVVCGTPIPPERLEALPDTPYCLADAGREERK